jgi:DNA invertase Pin-like site-specific DNA recombinase
MRVSTRGQGKSGVGLEAQPEMIARFAQANGFEVVAEHQEIETGKGVDALDRRPMLRKALAQAKRLALERIRDETTSPGAPCGGKRATSIITLPRC